MDDQDRYSTPSTAQLISLGERRPLKATSRAQKARDRSAWITSRAELLFGAYRRDEFADPESFVRQVGMVLERYDDEVIEHITSPLTGVQRKCKFPPSIAEIVEACDAERHSQTYAAQYDRRSTEQLQGRADDEALEKAEPLEYRRAVAERILAEYHAQRTPETRPQRQTWKQFTTEELLAKYSPARKD